MAWPSKLSLLNCTLYSNEANPRNQFKRTSRKEHKAEKIIQKNPLSPSLFNNVSTDNHKAAGNNWSQPCIKRLV